MTYPKSAVVHTYDKDGQLQNTPIRAYHTILKDNGWLTVYRERDAQPEKFPPHRIHKVTGKKDND